MYIMASSNVTKAYKKVLIQVYYMGKRKRIIGPYFTTGDVAKILGVSQSTVLRWIYDGKINAVYKGIWLIPESEVKRLIMIFKSGFIKPRKKRK